MGGDPAAIEGGCRCGAVRYRIDLPALPPAYACHCHLCQRWSGSAFSLNLLVAEQKLSVDGPIAHSETITEDRVSTQWRCAVCHSRVYNLNTGRPGIAVVRAGTLDRSEALRCVGHIYTDWRQRWFDLPADVPTWPGAPDPEGFVALMTGGQA